MSTIRLPLALLVALLGLALVAGPALMAQDEPSLFGDEEEEEIEEDAPLINAGPSVPEPPLSKDIDFERWRAMNGRERYTFVEGAVLTLDEIVTLLRQSLPSDARTPPEQLAFLVKFVGEHHPRRAPSVYLKEMDRIYLTSEGQRMSIYECFLTAFRRHNHR